MGETEIEGGVAGSEGGVAAGRDMGPVVQAEQANVNNYYNNYYGEQAQQDQQREQRSATGNAAPRDIVPQLIEVQRPLIEALDKAQKELRSYIEATLAATDLASESEVARRWLDWRIEKLKTPERIEKLSKTPEEYRISGEEWDEIKHHLEKVSELIAGFPRIAEVVDAMQSLSESVDQPFSQASSGRRQPSTEHLAILQSWADAIDDTLTTAKRAFNTCRGRAKQILDDVKDDVVRILEVADMTRRFGAGQVAAFPQESQVRPAERSTAAQSLASEVQAGSSQSNTGGGAS